MSENENVKLTTKEYVDTTKFDGNLSPVYNLSVGLKNDKEREIYRIGSSFSTGGKLELTDTTTNNSYILELSKDIDTVEYVNSRPELPIFAYRNSETTQLYDAIVKSKLPGHKYKFSLIEGSAFYVQISSISGNTIFLNGNDINSRKIIEINNKDYYLCNTKFMFPYSGCNRGIGFYVNDELVYHYDGDDGETVLSVATNARTNELFNKYFSLYISDYTTDDFGILIVNEPNAPYEKYYTMLDCPRGITRKYDISEIMYNNTIECFNDNIVYKIDIDNAFNLDLSNTFCDLCAKFNLWVEYKNGSIIWPSNWVWTGETPTLVYGNMYYIEAENVGNVIFAKVKYSIPIEVEE